MYSRASATLVHQVQNIVKSAVDVLFNAMSDALANAKRIEVRGFGCFSLKYRAPGKVRNQCHGLTIESGPLHNVYFRTGKALATRVNSINEFVISSLPEIVKKTTITQRKHHD